MTIKTNYMNNDEFTKAYNSLNKQQREAVDRIEGPVMVIAGPGTGKTQILTLRIANILLKTQINPENILALTFSESASFQMRDRLSRVIGTSAFKVDISTFHSFANEIIKNYPDEFPRLLLSENITEVEQITLIEKLINILNLKLLRPFGEPLYYLRDILSSINDLKKEGVGPDNLEIGIGKQKKDFDTIQDLYHEKGAYKGTMKGKYQELKKDIEKEEEFLLMFKAYQGELMNQKKYDFNDMLLDVIEALKTNKSLLLRIQEKYQYILVDEHQDTNAAQNKLVELVASFHEIPNLFVVGDEKQAIYRFQGASLENFLYFKNLYPQAKLINLETNYRSHQLILDASQSMIEKNISANILPQKNLIAGGDFKGEKIEYVCLSNYHLEYEYIAKSIAQKISEGMTSSSIAVLGRRNMDLSPLVSVLTRHGIKSVIASDQDVLSDLQIQKLVMILESINNPFDEILLLRAMHVDFLGIDPFDVYRILKKSRDEKKDIFSLFELEGSEKIKEFYSKYKGWVSLNNNIPFDDLFVKVINESGLKEYFLKLDDRYQVLNKITVLFDEIKLHLFKNPQFNLSDFLNLLNVVKMHKVSLKAKTENNMEEGVRLLTVHKSKGLEFDWVYIINCFDGRWGNARKRGVKIKIPWEYLGEQIKAKVDFESIEDERRLFYVALTRAKKGITLSFSKTGIEGKEQLPSQFLQEINSDFTEEINVEEFEKSFDKATLLDEIEVSNIDPKNQEYLQSIFREKGLSITGLENFLECPWKYFFRNLVVLPDVKNKYLIFGTAIHAIWDFYIKSRKTKNITADILVNRFKENMEMQAITEKDRRELMEKGERAIKLFYDSVAKNWPEDIQSEMNIRGVKLADDIVLNGRLDMIEVLSNNGEVRVHDFKTGKVKSRTQIDGSKEGSDYNYLRQLTFYKILLDKYREGLFKMKEGVIDFVEPDEKDQFKSETFIISETEVKVLTDQIKYVANEILSLSFWDTKCDDKDCEYCKLREMSF